MAAVIRHLLMAAAMLGLLPSPAFAQTSIIEQLPAINTNGSSFPLPDPAVTPSHLWITQGCATATQCDYKISPTQLGFIYQGNCATLTTPFQQQLCWNTTVSPAILEVFEGSAWSNFPNVLGFAPLASPNFTGIPTAPTAARGDTSSQIATDQFVANQTRILLTADTPMYVTPGGNDLNGDGSNNNCTVQSAPCATIQHVFNRLEKEFDLRGHTVTIYVADGTYSAGGVLSGVLVGQIGPENLVLTGNVANPDNVVINDPRVPLTDVRSGIGSPIVGLSGALLTIQGFYLQAGFRDLWNVDGGIIDFSNIDFGAAGDCQIYTNSGSIRATGNYFISGGGAGHFCAGRNGSINASATFAPGVSNTIAVRNTPAFTTAFAEADSGGQLNVNSMQTSFTGSGATGPRFLASFNGAIETGGAGLNYFPGNVPGAVSSGGQYDQLVSQRTRLQSNLTLYVATSGSDTNNPCTKQSAPCATAQNALDQIADNYDLDGFVVTVQLADGTYSAPISVGPTITGTTAGQVVIQGNTGNADAVVLAPTSCVGISTSPPPGFTVAAVQGGQATLAFVKINTTSCNGIAAYFRALLKFHDVDFGAVVAGGAQIVAHEAGQVLADGNYTISAGATDHVVCRSLAICVLGRSDLAVTVTLTGTPAFSGEFAKVLDNALLAMPSVTFVGSATGARYAVSNNATIDTGGAGATYLPGNAGGSAATNGIYN